MDENLNKKLRKSIVMGSLLLFGNFSKAITQIKSDDEVDLSTEVNDWAHSSVDLWWELRKAAEKGDEGKVKQLIDQGIDIKNDKEDVSLHIAAEFGHIRKCKLKKIKRSMNFYNFQLVFGKIVRSSPNKQSRRGIDPTRNQFRRWTFIEKTKMQSLDFLKNHHT